MKFSTKFKYAATIFSVFLMGALSILIVTPSYSDYRSRAEVASWRIQLKEKLKEIESQIQSGKEVAFNLNLEGPKPQLQKVTPSGTIIIGGGRDGQLLIMTPSFNGKDISWDCYVAPKIVAPPDCRLGGREMR